MGVRGLTTFIETNAEAYLKPFELHDTPLVIDGDSLCAQLFSKTNQKITPFGGHYDAYFRQVVDFFDMLQACRIVPYVLLDGGYESRKIATVRERMKQKVHSIAHLSLESTRYTMPLMLREVFVDAVRAAGVPLMRCAFEADDEVAILARKLDCPVMSYDSDFYIHNVRYIPFVTLTHRIYRKVTDASGDNFEIGIVDRTKAGTRHEVKFLAQCGDEALIRGEGSVTYDYLDCCLYTIENLIGPNERLGREMIPLFAVLLGNDYIERKVLEGFYRSIKSGRSNRKISQQQRRIKVILKWLQNHTLQSAIRTIVNQIRAANRNQIHRQMLTAMRGYNVEECVSYEFFGFREDQSSVDGTLTDAEVERNIVDCLGEAEEDSEQHSRPIDAESEEEDLNEESEEEDPDEKEEAATTNDDDDDEDGSDDAAENDEDDEKESDLELQEAPGPWRNRYTDHRWPTWFRELYRKVRTPRFVADLYHSRICINSPQMEDISKPDSNTISYPILHLIFALLSSQHPGPTRTSFRYITRKQRKPGVRYQTFEDVQLPDGLHFSPDDPSRSIVFMNHLFRECGVVEWEDLFDRAQHLPANMSLYFLAIIYWAKNCDDVNVVHVQALIVCVLQLQIVDRCLKNRNRDMNLFHKQHKQLLEERKGRKPVKPTASTESKSFSRTIYQQLASGVPRAELVLAYGALIRHFSVDEKLHRKNTHIDRSTVHTMAEFQSVCFNLYALNSLLGSSPFDSLRMHELYNSLFVYNVYETIKSRTDPCEYVRGTLFRDSAGLFEAFTCMVAFVVRYVPELNERKRGAVRHSKAKSSSSATGKGSAGGRKVGKKPYPPPANDWQEEEKPSDTDEEFVDVNNKFSQLLLAGV
ncbi:protein asteroid-like [Anopheles albimanus]|uniref:XPG_I_2 domain-containing protein n=1 Tax=Anopheles albimanus TaxID=7167 RepID=A0A182F5N7_ANOAL|nr:protein asteroid-like [Anopheles albimanus]